MDGPNVNHKFRELLVARLKELSPENATLLDIGTCSLPVVHGAFKTGIKAADWSSIPFLKACYNLFKNVLSRRADLAEFSDTSDVPLKFCVVRWLESGPVAKKAKLLLSSLQKYVTHVENLEIAPTCASFKTVKAGLEDPLLPVKLAFFESICDNTEPFLREFQTDDPMVPFLYESLPDLLQTFMEMFVKEEMLSHLFIRSICLKRIICLLPNKLSSATL